MHKIKASIITIGDELLIGQTIDTNSAWLGQQLNSRGIWIHKRIAVGDNTQDIITALDEARNESDIIIITGGLGPTADDITKPLLCNYFGGTLVENGVVKQHVIELFKKRGRKIIEVNLLQAMVPNCCTVLFNEMGTAPGMLFEQEGKIFISLPGVPFEMKHIMSSKGFEILQRQFKTTSVLHRTLVTAGEGESFIAQQLGSFEQTLHPQIKLAYLPQLGTVKLRLTGIDIEEQIIDNTFQQLIHLLADITFATEDIFLPQAINGLMIQHSKTLALAESCTGGAISSALTDIPHTSQYLKGCIVSYTNEIKTKLLHIDENKINEHTAVSEEVCQAMALNAASIFKTDYTLSITGYLDNDINDPKNKGIVYIGIYSQNTNNTIVKKIYLPYDRIRNKELVINIALNLLYRTIRNH